MPFEAGEGLTHTAHFFLESFEDGVFDMVTSFLIEWVSDIAKLAVFALFTGHCYEKAASALDDLDIADDEAVVECDGYVGFELIFVDGEDFDLGDFHNVVLSSCSSKLKLDFELASGLDVLE